MKKWIRNFALMAAMGGTSATLTTFVSMETWAQDKKEAKKAAAVGRIVIKEGKDSKFRFSIYDADDKFIAMSGPQGFPTKEDAEKGIERLKATLKDAKLEYGEKAEVDDTMPKKAAPKKNAAKKDPN